MIEAINALTEENARLKAENTRLRKICDPQTELEALELLSSERKEAARDCVEIALAMPVDEYGNGQCGEIAELILDHFGLGE